MHHGRKIPIDSWVVRGTQKCIHLLLKNPEEREEIKKQNKTKPKTNPKTTNTTQNQLHIYDRTQIFKIFSKHLKKVDDRMHCTACTMHI